jgi:hypothetical protein
MPKTNKEANIILVLQAYWSGPELSALHATYNCQALFGLLRHFSSHDNRR